MRVKAILSEFKILPYCLPNAIAENKSNQTILRINFKASNISEIANEPTDARKKMKIECCAKNEIIYTALGLKDLFTTSHK